MAEEAQLTPEEASAARRFAGRVMSEAGSVRAAAGSFEAVAAVVWPGDSLPGDRRRSLAGHRVVVVLVEQHVSIRGKRPPTPPGVTLEPPPRPIGVLLVHDLKDGAPLGRFHWGRGGAPPFPLDQIGPVLTLDVPVAAVRAAAR